ENRTSTFTPALWYRQSIGASRASLVYSGGVALVMTRSEQRFSVFPSRGFDTAPALTTKLTRYTAAAVVGVDARIPLSDHASIVPGFRTFISNDAIFLRPSLGVRWQF